MRGSLILLLSIGVIYGFHFEDVESRTSFVSDIDDASLLFINPSALSLNRSYLSVDVETPYNMIDGLKLFRGSGAFSTRFGVMGTGIYSMGNSMASENLIRFAHGFFIKDSVSLGYGINLLNCTYRDIGSYFSYSFDISMSSFFYSRYSFGFQFRNVNRVKMEGIRYPSIVSAGLSYITDEYVISFQVEKAEIYPVSFKARFKLKEPLLLSFYISPYPVEMGMSMGINKHPVSVIYHAVYSKDLPFSHRLIIIYRP